MTRKRRKLAPGPHSTTRVRKLARSTKLLPTGAVTQQEFDLDKSKLTQAEADLRSAVAGIASTQAEVASATAAEQSAQAAIAIAELNLKYTTVTATVSGRVSRQFVTVGNLVQAGQNGGGTLLTTIVSVDPIYAYFDVDENTVQRVQQMIREGRAKSRARSKYHYGLAWTTTKVFRIKEPSTSSTIRCVRARARYGSEASFPIRTKCSCPAISPVSAYLSAIRTKRYL